MIFYKIIVKKKKPVFKNVNKTYMWQRFKSAEYHHPYSSLACCKSRLHKGAINITEKT